MRRRFFSNFTTSISSNRPLVAIVGKPNVGKSTLFNRLVGGNKALITNVPGTTRDRLYGTIEWLGKEMDVVDTGGMFQDENDFFFGPEVMDQALMATEEANLVAMVVDGRQELDDKDHRVAKLLRKKLNEKNVCLVVNKLDNDEMVQTVMDHRNQKYRNMGLGEPFYVSALHADGTVELVNYMFDALFPDFNSADRKSQRKLIKELQKSKRNQENEDSAEENEKAAERPFKIAVVGRPNVGKSSLVNRIIGGDEMRSVVSDISGTTHDTIGMFFSCFFFFFLVFFIFFLLLQILNLDGEVKRILFCLTQPV